jgi:hypothetical protein
LRGLRFGHVSVRRAFERLLDSVDQIPIAAGLHDLRTLRAVEQSNECDARSDGQEVAESADGAADGDDKVKSDREQ